MTNSTEIQPIIHTDNERLWRNHFVASQALFDAVQHDLQQEISLLLIHYEILSRLAESPIVSLRMSELASSAQSSRSRLSHAISRLEELGYVERKECPSDRRGAFAVITERGMETYLHARPHVLESLNQHLFSILKDVDCEHLAAIQSAILEHLASEKVIPSQCTER